MLEGLLRKVAAYVQIMCNEDPALLLSSGFQMQSTNRTSNPLEKPAGLTLKNGVAGQLLALSGV